jgi:uracil-DNA glycosylase
MDDKPRYCYDSGCPLADKAKGFALDYGDPRTAKLCIHLEAPGKDEIVYQLLGQRSQRQLLWVDENELNKAEVARRRKWLDPKFAKKFLERGAALVGMSWVVQYNWILKKFGLERKDLYITNSLRCLPPKNKDGDHYPTGKDRTGAEAACRHWDRLEEFILFAPKSEVIALVSMHPAYLLREATPLRLVLEHFKKANDIIRKGGRALVLLGGKAVKLRLGYFDNVMKTQGHYEWLRVAK